ncbi:MAG: AbgT family transporter [Marinisporobacter sp.]|jgi:aminobenzoyl-glutamate transport protein|nr:AbgT family transporter [Marinisporobacter sp.]
MRNTKINYKSLAKKLEAVGNKIPHPFWSFTILILITILLSSIVSGKESYFVNHSAIARLQVNNLANIEYFISLIGDMDEVFLYFKPLSVVILIFMGISVFQGSGAISAIIRGVSTKIPIKMMIFFIAFIGVNSNIVSDVGVIVIPTLFAALFQSLNFNPWIGIIVGYASVNGGFTLNMFIAGTDIILSEITNTVLVGLGMNATINPFSNWYFMFVGCCVIIILTMFITEKYTKKILRNPEHLKNMDYYNSNRLSNREKKGLKYLVYTNFLYFMGLLVMIKYYNVSQGVSGWNIRFIFSNIVGIIFFYFTITGLVFGMASGTIKKIDRIPELFASGITGAKIFIVTALPAAVFVKVLGDSNLDSWMGILISDLLLKIHMPPIVILMFFMIIVSLLNLVISSSSVKWLFIAPIAIPIFNTMNISPQIVQLAYRIGDTVTNCISPTDYYLPIMISLLEMYKTDNKIKVGVGTIISLCIPYTVAYFIGLSILFIIWYLLAIPIGF